MYKIWNQYKQIWKNPLSLSGVGLVAVIAFVTQLISPTVGIDDTAYKLYFVDGVAPAAGRWVLYLLKIFFPMDYNPYFMEFLGIVFFVLSASLWCVVFARIFGDKVPNILYGLAAGMMVSSPILAEVAVWYLQNGIYVGYGLVALAVLLFDDCMNENEMAKKIRSGLWSLILFFISVGLYESFITVYVMGVFLLFAGGRLFGDESAYKKVSQWFVAGAGIMAGMLVLRGLIMKVLESLFHLENQKLLNTRGAGEFLAWFGPDRSFGDFLYLIKSFFVKYYVAGIIYFPALMAATVMVFLVAWMVVKGIRKKDFWMMLTAVAIVILPMMMSVMEGVASYYRSAQYIPVLTGFSVMAIGYEICLKKKMWIRIIGGCILFVLLYQQCYNMNHWFYIEKIKYEDAKETVYEITQYLAQNGLENHPVCLVGSYEMPDILWEECSVPAWSKKSILFKKIIAYVDPKLLSEYETKSGVCAAETPKLNFINWSTVAFHTYDRELSKFAKMHGWKLTEDLNTSHYESAEKILKDSPVWPVEESFTEMEEFVAIRIGR